MNEETEREVPDIWDKDLMIQPLLDPLEPRTVRDFVQIEYKHHAETPAGWTEDWTIRASGSDALRLASSIYKAHDILLNGPKTKENN